MLILFFADGTLTIVAQSKTGTATSSGTGPFSSSMSRDRSLQQPGRQELASNVTSGAGGSRSTSVGPPSVGVGGLSSSMSADQAAAPASRGITPSRAAAPSQPQPQSHSPQQIYATSKSATQTPVHSAHYGLQNTRAVLSAQQANGGGGASTSASPAQTAHSAHMQIISNPLLSSAGDQQQLQFVQQQARQSAHPSDPRYSLPQQQQHADSPSRHSFLAPTPMAVEHSSGAPPLPPKSARVRSSSGASAVQQEYKLVEITDTRGDPLEAAPPQWMHADAERSAALSHQMAAHLTLEQQQQQAWYLQQQQQQYYLQQQVHQQQQHLQTAGGQQPAAGSSMYSMQQSPMYSMPYPPTGTSSFVYPMPQQQASHSIGYNPDASPAATAYYQQQASHAMALDLHARYSRSPMHPSSIPGQQSSHLVEYQYPSASSEQQQQQQSYLDYIGGLISAGPNAAPTHQTLQQPAHSERESSSTNSTVGDNLKLYRFS